MLLVNSQAMIWAASIPLCVALLALTYWKYVHYRKALMKDRRKRKWIFKVLKAANETNRFLYLRFVSSNISKKDIKLETKKLDKNQLYCTTDLEALNSSCLKQPTTVFFYLNKHHKKIKFYSFDAIITELSPKTSCLELSLTLPKSFGSDQRRQLLRLEPSQSLIENFSVWSGQIAQIEEDKEVKVTNSTGKLAKPESDSVNSASPKTPAAKSPQQSITWVGIPQTMAKIQNISGGGLKMFVNATYAQQNKLDCNSLFLMKLSLKNTKLSPQNPLPQLNFVLVGSCIHTSQGIDECSLIRQKGLGIMFLRFALPDPDKAKKLTWLPIDSKQGILQLVAWVLETQYTLKCRTKE